MKTTPLLILLLSVASAFADDPPTPISGLVPAPAADALTPEEMARRFATTKDLPVPEPAKTPFDADPAARKVYLESYRGGYRSAAAGVFSTCCEAADTPHREAIIAGHYDGQRAAKQDHLTTK